MSRPTYTPGPGGYAFAVVVSLLVFVLGVTVVAAGVAAVEGQLDGEIFFFIYIGLMYGAVPALLLGTPGAFAVHYLCRHEPRQWVHVIAAGVAGVLAGLLIWLVFVREPVMLIAVAGLGIATAIGRAVVIPLVRPQADRQHGHQVGLSL